MRIRHIARLTTIGALFCSQGVLAGSAAQAEDFDLNFDPGQVRIGQINPQITPEPRGRMPIEQNYAQHLDSRISAMLGVAERLAESTVVQRGIGNTATSETKGSNNVTGQFQNGAFNFSGIGIDGSSNKVVTFQNGNRAHSELEVIGGNKTIYHMQFGETQRVKEIFRGAGKEKLLIIDKGRHGAYVARIK
jgi:hypothetical protein